MAKSELKNIFLSASIPVKESHQIYIETADIIAIRDAVIALTSVVLPKHRLIWGGHPSITPLIYYVMERLNLDIQKHVKLYQSSYFANQFPDENKNFKNIIFTESLGNLEESVKLMREQMLSENSFAAAVFIGGMEGIEIEYKMFNELHPNAILLPIASTGAATKLVYDNLLPDEQKNKRFIKDYGYMSLFQNFLIDKI